MACGLLPAPRAWRTVWSWTRRSSRWRSRAIATWCASGSRPRAARCARPRRAGAGPRAARKFGLAGGAAGVLEVGSLRVDVARPDYARVLSEEVRDAVVGDVFSLGLGLPLAMKRRDPGWRSVRLFWLVQPYTPERMRRE